MATDYERLAVLLEARVADFERNIARATRNADRQFNRIQRSAETMSNRVGAAAGGMALRVAGAFAAAASAKAVTALMDSATKIENALKVAGLAGDELKTVYDALFASAQKNAAPLESLTTLYSRLALTQKELGVSQQELIGFTDKIALALRVGGTSASEASGALLQLSQALGGGVVRAEEFNSVLEGAPTIAQAAAAGLKEAGGSVANLRKLVVDGKVSSEAFFRAFEAGAVTLEQKVAGSESTVSQGFVRLQNVLTDTAGKIDKATGSSGKLGGAINELADVIKDFGNVVVAASESDLGKFLGWLSDGIGKVNELKRLMGGLPGVFVKINQLNHDAFNGLPLGTAMRQDRIQSRIEGAFAETASPVIPKGGRLPAAPSVKPVSIDDYTVPASSSNSSRSRQDDLQREIAQIRERTAALNAAYAAQAAVNPLMNDYGYAVEKAAAKQDLLTAAQKAGKEVTPELEREIDALVEGYANAVVASEQLAEKQDEIRQRAEDALNTAKDVTRGMIDGFVDGADAADILADSLRRIGDALLNDVLDSIFKVNNASGGGGFLSGILGLFGGGSSKFPSGSVGLYSDGGYTGPGGKYQPAGVVHKGEYVFDAEATRRIGVDNLRRLQGYAQGGLVGAPRLPSLRPAANSNTPSITFAPVYNVQGSGPEIAQLRQQMAKDKAEFPAQVLTTMRKARKTRDWRGR